MTYLEQNQEEEKPVDEEQLKLLKKLLEERYGDPTRERYSMPPKKK